MDAKPLRRRQAGFAPNAVVFALTCISVTAGATLTLYTAYLNLVAKPKETVRVEQLSQENERLKMQLWQEQVLNAARVLETRTNLPDSGKLPDAIRFRGLSDDQMRVRRVSDALDTLEKVFGSEEFKRNPDAVSKGFDGDELLHLRADLKDRRKWVNDHIETRSSPIDKIVKDRTEPERDEGK